MAVNAATVREIQFDKAPFGTRGYNDIEVDRFLDRVAATLDGEDDITVDDVHNVSFNRAPLNRRGYDQAAVDAFLRLVESTFIANVGSASIGAYVAPALEHTHARKRPWQRT